jgi:hypothetical protein
VHTLASRGVPELATCSITELGFVRVLAQAPQYGFTSPTREPYYSALKHKIR